MVLILPEHSQRPYRYGMTLLCVGAMFNWLGLADNNAEPVRYIGVSLIAAGAILICLAMCFWMKATHDPQVAIIQSESDPVHHIVTIHHSDSVTEKPPDYDSVTGCLPPCYEDAIRLSPVHLLTAANPVGSVITQASEQSTSTVCLEQSQSMSVPEDSAKPEQVNKHNTGIAADTSQQAECSTESNDTFGSRVLRLSRRFLRRSKSVPQDLEEVRSPSQVASTETSDSSVR